MEGTYYFSQGRLIHNVSSKKNGDIIKDIADFKDISNSNNKDNSIFNFKVFNASFLRYK
jgi:hypothetical protein